MSGKNYIDPTAAPVALIGLGAQKSGSTWLWNYLRGHPQCTATALKELHLITSNPRHLEKQASLIEQEIAAANREKDMTFLIEKRDIIQRAQMIKKKTIFSADGFLELVTRPAVGKFRISAELSPSNGNMSGKRMRELASHHSGPKFVLVLRDPVDRLWSQIRMAASQKSANTAGFLIMAEKMAADFLQGSLDLPVRHNYRTILRRAENNIPRERIFYAFYEDFFEQKNIDAFCYFLAVDPMSARLAEPVFPGHPLDLRQELARKMRDALIGQYTAAEKSMGRLPPNWEKMKQL
jgi:hypothetical protein